MIRVGVSLGIIRVAKALLLGSLETVNSATEVAWTGTYHRSILGFQRFKSTTVPPPVCFRMLSTESRLRRHCLCKILYSNESEHAPEGIAALPA